MARRPNSVPTLRKTSDGGWRVRIGDTEYRVGTAKTPMDAVQAEYAKLIARAATNGVMGKRLRSGSTLEDLCKAFLLSDESPVGLAHRQKFAQLPGLFDAALGDDFPADEYDGERHREFKAWLIGSKRFGRWSVNEWLMRVRRLMKFGQSRRVCRGDNVLEVLHVPGVRSGDGRVKDSVKVAPADLAHVEKTIPHLPAVLQPLVRLQLACGARAGELVSMRAGEIDRSATPWAYRPARHKGQWRGHERVIYLGPSARRQISPLLANLDSGDVLFPSRRGRRLEHYTRFSYQSAIKAACRRAKVPVWTSHQLRHRCGTEVRAVMGEDHAQAILGHIPKGVTGRYTREAFDRFAREAAERMG